VVCLTVSHAESSAATARPSRSDSAEGAAISDSADASSLAADASSLAGSDSSEDVAEKFDQCDLSLPNQIDLQKLVKKRNFKDLRMLAASIMDQNSKQEAFAKMVKDISVQNRRVSRSGRPC
jgi:hypothetical protein